MISSVNDDETLKDKRIEEHLNEIDNQHKVVKEIVKEEKVILGQYEDYQYQVMKVYEKEKYRCIKCDRIFGDKDELKSHFFSTHPLTCYHCQYEATQKGSLKNHIDSIHDNVRYPCPYCGKKLVRKTLLKNHIKSFHKNVMNSTLLKSKLYIPQELKQNKDDLTTNSWFL